MNTTRFAWGIVCLALAGLAAIAAVVLPPAAFGFAIRGQSPLWILFGGLCMAGCGLLLAAGISAWAQVGPAPSERAQSLEKSALNKRLTGVSWGAFLILLGAFALAPGGQAPQGLWSIGIGTVLLGLNAARYFSRLRMSGFTTFVGVLSLLGGFADLVGANWLQGASLLILVGAVVILKPWFDRQQLFGKAEEV